MSLIIFYKYQIGNLEPIVFEINKEEIPEIVDEAIKNMNSLILDPSYIPTYYLSKETSKYTKAVVSGDGADEILVDMNGTELIR